MPLLRACARKHLHDAKDFLPAIRLPARRADANFLRALLEEIGVMAGRFLPAAHGLAREFLGQHGLLKAALWLVGHPATVQGPGSAIPLSSDKTQ